MCNAWEWWIEKEEKNTYAECVINLGNLTIKCWSIVKTRIQMIYFGKGTQQTAINEYHVYSQDVYHENTLYLLYTTMQ